MSYRMRIEHLRLDKCLDLSLWGTVADWRTYNLPYQWRNRRIILSYQKTSNYWYTPKTFQSMDQVAKLSLSKTEPEGFPRALYTHADQR